MSYPWITQKTSHFPRNLLLNFVPVLKKTTKAKVIQHGLWLQVFCKAALFN